MPRRQLVIDVAIKSVEDLRRVDNDVLRCRGVDTIHEFLEEGHVLDVERAVRAEIGEAVLAAMG